MLALPSTALGASPSAFVSAIVSKVNVPSFRCFHTLVIRSFTEIKDLTACVGLAVFEITCPHGVGFGTFLAQPGMSKITSTRHDLAALTDGIRARHHVFQLFGPSLPSPVLFSRMENRSTLAWLRTSAAAMGN